MSEEVRIETVAKSFRLPVDVVETLDKWAEESGKTATAELATCVREAVTAREALSYRAENSVIQGESVIRTRDDLARAFIGLAGGSKVSVGDSISALGVARSHIYRQTPEFQGMSETRKGPSVYEGGEFQIGGEHP